MKYSEMFSLFALSFLFSVVFYFSVCQSNGGGERADGDKNEAKGKEIGESQNTQQICNILLANEECERLSDTRLRKQNRTNTIAAQQCRKSNKSVKERYMYVLVGCITVVFISV